MPAPEWLHTRDADAIHAILDQARAAQHAWGQTSVADRLAILRQARHLIAENCRSLAASVPGRDPSQTSARSSSQPESVQPIASAPPRSGSLPRNPADTLIAEVLPLAEAVRFLEREASSLLAPKHLGRHNRPYWLGGLQTRIDRVPFGVVLIIAPSNYPLFLPGVQTIQALAAGNAVLWKPAAGCSLVAKSLARLLTQAGLPDGLLHILEETPKAGIEAMRAGVDKVFVTGHADTGRSVMQELSITRTPSVMELSGCDAVFLLPGADLHRAAHALAFGLRLNGSATCMAPRRIFASPSDIQKTIALMLPMLSSIPPVPVAAHIRAILDGLLQEATRLGATIASDGRSADSDRLSPTLVTSVPADAALLRTDIFAPVLSFCPVENQEEALNANAVCPYALTAAIFGPPDAARILAAELRVGTVLINDLIVSTADPRISFGGRGASGFGVTRGHEGLLEMTAVKTTLHQKSRSLRPYAATGTRHEPFFASYIQAVHSGTLAKRFRAFRQLLSAAKHVEKN